MRPTDRRSYPVLFFAPKCDLSHGARRLAVGVSPKMAEITPQALTTALAREDQGDPPPPGPVDG
jgi:hypothetical protein